MNYNQINYQEPLQQTYNNTFKTFADYAIEKNMRQTVQQDMLSEYDFIIQEAYILLNEIYKYEGSSLIRDSNNVYFTYKGKDSINKIDNLAEIEIELSTVMPRPVKIITDTKTIVNDRRINAHNIYLPLFLINSKVEPVLLFDIYDNVKNTGYAFNLFTYTNYLNQRFETIQQNNKNEFEKLYNTFSKSVLLSDKEQYLKLTHEYFVKSFFKALTINNNSEYIEEWITHFFKTLRRTKINLVLVGNQDVSEEIFYNGIIKQIFGFDYCITVTDDMLENQTIEFIVKNRLFVHINHIPESKENQKKLKELIEGLIVYENISNMDNSIHTPFVCQIIFTLEQPDPFLSDFLSHSKVFFIDSIENINQKINQPDRVSLLNNITKNLIQFSKQLTSLDMTKVKSYSNQYQYLNLMQQEVINQRLIHYSNRVILNDTIEFKEKNYKSDNELFINWLKNPELMKLALSYNSQNPILDPFDDSFEKILPTEERYKHTYVTGKTGSGKSELLKTLILRDILRNDSSIILLDIHGDLANDVARMVKDKERLVFIDPTLEKDQTPTINLFHTEDKSEENIEQVSQMITAIINDINVGDTPSGTMIDLLENCIPLLVRTNNKDFYDLKRLLKDIPKITGTKEKQEEIKNKRNIIKSEINKFRKNEFEEEYFEDEFMDVNNSTRQSVRRRLNKMLKDSKFSNLTNGENKINLAKEMNSSKNKVIIFHIPKSKMLNTYSYYIKFIIGLIQIIALKRADLKESKRPHTHLYIDEFHNFITPTIEEILTESRKYKLFLTFAHQSVSQIKDSNLRDIILDNTNVKIIGKNSNKTLEAMNKTLNTKLEDVAKLTAGEFNLQSGVNDIIRIKNTDKLLDGKESISDEDWEEHKQYQLEHFYRSTKKQEIESIDAVQKEKDDKIMIEEFILAIKNKDLSDDSCLRKIEKLDKERYEEIEEDFNLDEPRIRQQEINILFQLAFNQDELIDSRKFNEELKNNNMTFTVIPKSRDKKFTRDNKAKTEKYYIIPT